MKILESRPVGFAVDPEVKAWYQKHVGDGADAVPEGCSTDIHCESKVIVSCRTGEAADTLVLCPKGLCVGIGCKRGTSFEQLEAALHQVFFENHLSLLGIRELASIDLKKEEVGVHALADHLRVPFHTWTAEELLAVPGVFTESAFVKETTGVGNVCERAAVLAAGTGSRLLVKKQAMQGVTIAVAW
jgi:cobalt-precorrin 5A hydrolase